MGSNKDLLPGREDTVGTTEKDNRLFVEAVLYRYRAGIPWRDIPERFGEFRVIHTRHTRWSKTGVWKEIFEILAKDADNEYSMIDSTIVRAHQHSAGAKKKSKWMIKLLCVVSRMITGQHYNLSIVT
jgi:transposase